MSTDRDACKAIKLLLCRVQGQAYKIANIRKTNASNYCRFCKAYSMHMIHTYKCPFCHGIYCITHFLVHNATNHICQHNKLLCFIRCDSYIIKFNEKENQDNVKAQIPRILAHINSPYMEIRCNNRVLNNEVAKFIKNNEYLSELSIRCHRNCYF